jgi:hypothetical protein
MKSNFGNIVCFILLFAVISYIDVLPQSIQKSEIEFSKLVSQLDIQTKKLDSLNSVYKKKIEQIEREKSKSERDDSKIVKLMSSSVSVSKNIDDVQKNINRLQTGIENIKKKLYALYTHVIDSLNNSSSKSSAKVQDDIILIKEKRLLVLPRILPLSYNPEKIISLDLNNIKNKDEAAIINDYIKNAKIEADQVYTQINNTISDIGHIVKLEKKTKKFIDETGFDSGIKQGSISRMATKSLAEGWYNGLDPSSADQEISMQFNSYNFILNQLRSIDTPDFGATGFNSVSKITSGISFRQYLKILEEIKEGLEDYRLILNKKTGNR